MSLGYSLQVLCSFVLLAGALFLFSKMAKRVQKYQFTEEIKVLDRKGLDQGISLVLVSVKDHEFLLGISGKDVKVLDKIK
jgi:flagellar biogenesis protein FliO